MSKSWSSALRWLRIWAAGREVMPGQVPLPNIHCLLPVPAPYLCLHLPTLLWHLFTEFVALYLHLCRFIYTAIAQVHCTLLIWQTLHPGSAQCHLLSPLLSALGLPFFLCTVIVIFYKLRHAQFAHLPWNSITCLQNFLKVIKEPMFFYLSNNVDVTSVGPGRCHILELYNTAWH